jgi:hypothetical protein
MLASARLLLISSLSAPTVNKIYSKLNNKYIKIQREERERIEHTFQGRGRRQTDEEWKKMTGELGSRAWEMAILVKGTSVVFM